MSEHNKYFERHFLTNMKSTVIPSDNNNIFLKPFERNKHSLTRVLRWENDPHTSKYLFDGGAEKDIFEILKTYKDYPHQKDKLIFEICEKDRPIGIITLENINFIKKFALMSIYIGETDRQKNGIANIATKALFKVCKNQGLRSIFGVIYNNNVVSKAFSNVFVSSPAISLKPDDNGNEKSLYYVDLVNFK